MDYGKILTRAWEITWRWKILWVLGFLAALGNAGGSGSSSGSSSYTPTGDEWNRWWWRMHHGPEFPARVIAIIIGVGCLVLLIGIAIWVVSVIARGGLITGVQQVEEEGDTSFGRAWRAGASRFWTLFGISFLAAIPMFILVAGGIVALLMWLVPVASTTDPSDAAIAMSIVTPMLCCGIFCCGLIIVAVVLQQIRLYAERAAMLEEMGWIEAFTRGWNVLKANVAPTLIFWAIFFAIGLAIFAVVAVVLIATAIPFAAVAVNVDPGPWLLVPICGGGLIAVLVGSLISAVVETFTSATWTLAYREMVGLAAPAETLAIEPSEDLAP